MLNQIVPNCCDDNQDGDTTTSKSVYNHHSLSKKQKLENIVKVTLISFSFKKLFWSISDRNEIQRINKNQIKSMSNFKSNECNWQGNA